MNPRNGRKIQDREYELHVTRDHGVSPWTDGDLAAVVGELLALKSKADELGIRRIEIRWDNPTSGTRPEAAP